MWDYSDKLMDHFLNPRNVGEVPAADGVGEVGNISCGDALRLTFKLDGSGRIADIRFKTFGCGSAIASSSILTEMVKGKTLEEALAITNQDIASALGGMPKEKMHCSVMGAEALRAAIANFRGEPVEDACHGDQRGAVVCHCFGVTDEKIRRIARENGLKTLEEVTAFCKAGGACGSCHEAIRAILQETWAAPPEPPREAPATPQGPDGDAELDFVQAVMRIKEVMDGEIRPALEADGGGVDFKGLDGHTVKLRLKGRCASCPGAMATIKGFVEAKLREKVWRGLRVESV